MDSIDRAILTLLQDAAGLPITDIARRVGVSTTPCWNRIKKMEEQGVITGRTVTLDREQIGLPIVVFLSISVSTQSPDWTARFADAVNHYPEIIEVHRITGTQSDYLMKVVASDISDYDAFQQKLISDISFTTMSSGVSLQEIKYTTKLPLSHLGEE
jgi:Lrp/AsnC family transcriptional regulator